MRQIAEGERDVAIWWLKSCPKCGGDVVEERDVMALALKCFQCGRELNALEVAALRARFGRQRPTWIQAKKGSWAGLAEEQKDGTERPLAPAAGQ